MSNDQRQKPESPSNEGKLPQVPYMGSEISLNTVHDRDQQIPGKESTYMSPSSPFAETFLPDDRIHDHRDDESTSSSPFYSRGHEQGRDDQQPYCSSAHDLPETQSRCGTPERSPEAPVCPIGRDQYPSSQPADYVTPSAPDNGEFTATDEQHCSADADFPTPQPQQPSAETGYSSTDQYAAYSEWYGHPCSSPNYQENIYEDPSYHGNEFAYSSQHPTDPGLEEWENNTNTQQDTEGLYDAWPAYKLRLIVCCDDTGNDPYDPNKPMSNVSRLVECLAMLDDRIQEGQAMQYCIHRPGIGSHIELAESNGKRGWRRVNKSRSNLKGAVGAGIEQTILTAYQFLCEQYGRPCDTEIILVGFSRGALIARVLAALISDMGVLSDRGLRHLPAIFERWKAQRNCYKDLAAPERLVRYGVWSKFPNPHYYKCRCVPIKAVAVWDTVPALGVKQATPNIHHKLSWRLPYLLPKLELQEYAFVRSPVPTMVERTFHALTLDKNQSNFPFVVWDRESVDPSRGQTLEEKRFLDGSHSHGGDRNGDRGNKTANDSLVWMVAQLQPYVHFDRDKLQRLVKCTSSSYRPNNDYDTAEGTSFTYCPDNYYDTTDTWPRDYNTGVYEEYYHHQQPKPPDRARRRRARVREAAPPGDSPSGHRRSKHHPSSESRPRKGTFNRFCHNLHRLIKDL